MAGWQKLKLEEQARKKSQNRLGVSLSGPSIHKALAPIPGNINKLTKSLWLGIVVVYACAARTQKTETRRLRL